MTAQGKRPRQRQRQRVVVVGAGSAGAVIASRLSQNREIDVLLLESGPDVPQAYEAMGTTSCNFVDALEVPNRNLRIPVRRTAAQDVSEYVRGIGTGGSSSVNAMVGMWGMASDYDRWARDLGCVGWSWRDVAPVFANLPLPLYTTLHKEWGDVDNALVNAAVETGFERRDDLSMAPFAASGVGSLSLTCIDGRRASVNDIYLEPARSRPNLEIRGNSAVDRLNINGSVVLGVHLANGEDIDADAVVVSAGAIVTPQILLRTNIARSGIGRGVKDHPAVSFTLALKESSKAKYAVSTLVRATSTTHDKDGIGNIHLLPMNLTGQHDTMHGAMFVALMRVRSTGSITLANTTTDTTAAAADVSRDLVVELNMLSDERDMATMAEATLMLLDMLERPSFSNISDAVMCDAFGTSVSALTDMNADQICAWLMNQVGSYSHIGCSSKMGALDDEDAVVDTDGRVIGYQNVWVCDASIFPDLPTGNTHLPVVMMAERISQRMSEALKSN